MYYITVMPKFYISKVINKLNQEYYSVHAGDVNTGFKIDSTSLLQLKRMDGKILFKIDKLNMFCYEDMELNSEIEDNFSLSRSVSFSDAESLVSAKKLPLKTL